ncbi:copper resistance protein CopD [Flavobacterium agricola]|uniref:Copper resistance protein CopD n=1 Tax=Flavobacterium agricola TaxID=2870839 RepID=A0ABY6M1A9_9FLAO|nr:copper resistance protein CopD [Flavobacterium agricola]UYW02294.1 copper resistance protein CopD [Flavobacterium agricola]
MEHQYLLLIHLLAACIWVGGHLVLAIVILPEVLKKKSPELLLNFERKYEYLGLPSLLLLVITGVWMGYGYGVTVRDWFHFDNPIETVISVKLIFLILTVAFAINANFFVLPKLSAKTLPLMAFHIICVTILGIAFVFVGSSVRFGGL